MPPDLCVCACDTFPPQPTFRFLFNLITVYCPLVCFHYSSRRYLMARFYVRLRLRELRDPVRAPGSGSAAPGRAPRPAGLVWDSPVFAEVAGRAAIRWGRPLGAGEPGPAAAVRGSRSRTGRSGGELARTRAEQTNLSCASQLLCGDVTES